MQHMRRSSQKHQPKAIEYVACYGLYALLLVLCYVLFLAWKDMASQLLSTVSGNNYSNTAFYALIVVLIGLALFVVAMISEPYLRSGVARGKLIPRFAMVAGMLIGFIALGLALQELVRFIPIGLVL